MPIPGEHLEQMSPSRKQKQTPFPEATGAAAEMGTEILLPPPSSSSSSGQLVSPHPCHPFQQGWSLVPVLHLEEDGNSVYVMGLWEPVGLDGGQWELMVGLVLKRHILRGSEPPVLS